MLGSLASPSKATLSTMLPWITFTRVGPIQQTPTPGAVPQAEHLAVVIEGVRIFPGNTVLLMQATLLAAKRGFPAEAKALAERGMKVAKEPGEQDQFRIIASAFERDTDPAAPAEPAPAPAPAKKAEPFLLKQP